ncbi:MAG: hypothetical protein IJW36_00350, partial [Clostridia bacterium]|nr:hypothetical protein [Clostridia bacterium]
AEEGYVAKAGDDYYKSVAEAIEKADRVYITADTAEDVTLKSDSVVIVNEGVNYTGTVSRVTNEVEVTSDLTVYAGSYNAVMANYHSFSPVTKEVTVKLLRDLNLATKQTVKSSANLVFDLNGKTINSTYNAMGTLFVVSGNFTLKSSVEGAKINLLTKAGLVEVASSATDKVVNISNIDVTRTVSSSSNFILCRGTINVEDSTFTVENTSTQTILVQTNGIFNVENSTIDIKKSTSSASVIQLQINSQLNVNNSTMNFDGANSVLFATQDYASISIIGTELTFDNCLNKRIFSLKGNLTLGEGTVVNFNCKSAGLISSTFGGIEVVIDGAEINFADFSVNGGSFIELSSSSKLTITDSELSVLLYESSFGLPKFVKGATDVTISNLTTNIKGNPSGKTYTIDPSTAVWSAN